MRKLLTALLLLVPGVAHAEWMQATTKHFVVYSDDTPDHVSRFALSLERYDKAMRVLHKIADNPVAPSERVSIYVTSSESAIAALGAPGALGVYMPHEGRPVAFTIKRGEQEWGVALSDRTPKDAQISPAVVLRHEYAHHFMFSSWETSVLPTWYTEGFAEFHATAIEQKNGSMIFGSQPTYRFNNFIYDNTCSVRQILGTNDLMKLQLHTSCDYGDLYAWGWLITDYMMFTDGGPEEMAAYVTALNRGKSPEEAAKAFGDLDKLDKALRKFLERDDKLDFTVVPSDIRVTPPVLRKLTPGEAATIDVRMRIEAGIEKKAAHGVYGEAVHAAEPYPDDPAAQLVVADAAIAAQAFDEAETAARRALAADPKSIDAMIDIGRARMGKAAAAKSTDVAVWRDVRQWFANANHADPTNPLPLLLYYRSFIVGGETATPTALAGVNRAIDLAPYADGIGFTAAYAYLSQNRAVDARKALAPAAYDPDWPKVRERAAKMLKLIDDGQPAAAMEALLPWVKDPSYVEPKTKGGSTSD